jgi:hypothetical protein
MSIKYSADKIMSFGCKLNAIAFKKDASMLLISAQWTDEFSYYFTFSLTNDSTHTIWCFNVKNGYFMFYQGNQNDLFEPQNDLKITVGCTKEEFNSYLKQLTKFEETNPILTGSCQSMQGIDTGKVHLYFNDKTILTIGASNKFILDFEVYSDL